MACAYLFVPGDSERKFTRACSGAAQALILDLEDSVAPDQKIEARRIVQGMLRQAPAGKADAAPELHRHPAVLSAGAAPLLKPVLRIDPGVRAPSPPVAARLRG